MARWGNAYNFRVRVSATKDQAGEVQIVLPSQVTDVVGTEANDEFLCVVTADGGILLRKLER
jgi:hypothetical protein